MRRVGWSLPLVLVALAGGVAPARAGQFQVTACGDGPNRSWVPAVTGSSLAAPVSCPSSGGPLSGMAAWDTLGAPAPAPAGPGDSAIWTFTAPGTTTRISGLTVERDLGRTDASWTSFIDTGEGSTPLEACATACSGTASFSTAALQPPATTLRFGVRCPNGGCPVGTTSHDAWAAISRATVSVSDDTPPGLTAIGGSLWATGGYHHGTEQATFDATDDVGIASSTLRVDGVSQGAVSQSCDYTLTVPCAQLSGTTLAYDTTKLADGTHTVQLGVADAATNPTLSATQSITVDNTPPAAPGGLTVAGGDAYRTTNAFDLAWTNPDPTQQVAPLTRVHVLVCETAGSPCAPEQVLDITDRLPRLAVPYPGEWSVRLWLEDAAGNASIANAAAATVRLGPLPVVTQTLPGVVARVTARAKLSLQVLRAVRSGRRLVVTGAASKHVAGSLSGIYAYKRGKHTRTAKAAKVRPKDGGAFTLSFTIPSTVHGIAPGTVRVNFPGDVRYLARTLLVHVPRPHTR
jgi:hypothetical protein